MWIRKHKEDPDDKAEDSVSTGVELLTASETHSGSSLRRIRNVHWRNLEIAPEVFIYIRDLAMADRGELLAQTESAGKKDETIEEILRIADYHFIMGFRAPKHSALPDPQRPEGQMRHYGFLPLGIATDPELQAEALYVLIQDYERPVPVVPYLRHDTWSRLISLLGRHLHQDLHVILLGTGGRVVERAIDFFFYQVEIKSVDHADVHVATEPIPIDPQQNDPEQIKQARFWLREAVNSRASDVHLEPGDGRGRLRMRIDGELVKIQDRIPSADLVQVITWIKAQARMDISERRRPLDGGVRLAYVQDGNKRLVDVRVSTIPTIHGQKMVMRLLDPEAMRERVAKGLQGTVWHPALHKRLVAALSARDGIVLVTGPTGSGKTTTLNSSLFHLLKKYGDKRNMVTIEDPVEYNVHGINQIQVNEQAGVSFAKALRHILRQDPDIVLVGEIRDAETAAVAIQAALTGHLILATLHTNDALGAVERLQDLGASPFLIASTVRLFQAQRLVRTLCPKCGQSKPIKGEELERKVAASRLAPYRDRFMASDSRVFESLGCGHCNYTGFLGRTAVMEMVVSTPELVVGIEQRKATHELVAIARASGYTPMVENGVELIIRGETTLAEIEAISLNARIEEEHAFTDTP
jgi:type II secretory ATPase GspE/PulE/Tfp pilus assembly ATPase PilB-like protein